MKTIFISGFLFFSMIFASANATVGASGQIKRIYPAGNNTVYFSLKNDVCKIPKVLEYIGNSVQLLSLNKA